MGTLCVRARRQTNALPARNERQTKTKKFFFGAPARCSPQINECKRNTHQQQMGTVDGGKQHSAPCCAVGEERRLYIKINGLHAALQISVYIAFPRLLPTPFTARRAEFSGLSKPRLTACERASKTRLKNRTSGQVDHPKRATNGASPLLPPRLLSTPTVGPGPYSYIQ